jgi:UDP-glucose 4-epimerase
MKKIIVTGANGFIGSALVRELVNQGASVYALDRLGCNNNIPNTKDVVFIPCELADMKSLPGLLPRDDYDVFYHFAWVGSAGPARSDTALQLQNAQWTVDSLRVAKELGCRRFLCAGSIMEHETIAAAYKQGNHPGLAYIYGGGKVIAHILCMAVASDIGIELIWPEITNAYGVGELSPRMLNTTIRKIIHGEPLQFTSGTQNYDFVYVDDVARAFYLIGMNGKPFHEYLIGSSAAKPLREFLLEMKAAISPDSDFVFGNIPFTGTNLPLERFDCSQTESDTGFRAEVSFTEGVQRTMTWLKTMETKQVQQ